jgi:lipoate-protein ligase A
VDEWLYRTAGEPGGAVTWRTYTWSEPTLSLGYFQKAGSQPSHLAHLPYVRRLTGGGAILHDRELTYSLTIPSKHALAMMDTTALYERVHAAVATALAEFGVEAAPRGDCADPAGGVRAQRGPFLCFRRCHAQDLAVADCKVVGSAQRRNPKAVLQHGSIMLAASQLEPDLPGIRELTGRLIDSDELAERLSVSLAARFCVTWIDRGLDARELRQIEQLREETYVGPNWNDVR